VCCGKTFTVHKKAQSKPDETKLQESLCVHCLQSLYKYHRVACKTCGLGLGPRLQAFGWTHCRHCKNLRDLHFKTWVCSDYEPPFDQWIGSLKYGGAYEIAPFLAAWMSMRMQGSNGIHLHGLTWPDVWMAVPSHASRVKQRGYNQAALIA
jgi:predicted amidophosphoribosyltransferase